jgi:hypothetical protein
MRFLAESMGSLPRAHTVRVLLKTDLRSAQAHIFDAAGVLDPVEGGILLRTSRTTLTGWRASSHDCLSLSRYARRTHYAMPCAIAGAD